MFNTDKPIQSAEEDALRRAGFSKELASAILSYTKTDNFVISLCGPWGCGKTSIINLVIEEIEKRSFSEIEDEKPIIIKFNPWNYADCAQLISQFFSVISTSLKMNNVGKELQYVGEALEGYSSVLEYSQFIPVVGKYIKLLNNATAYTGKLIKKKAEKENDLEVRKKKVINALENQKHKFIIVIDDIDRLNNQQIRSVFQLVKALAGFPNMIYLLSFDREIVARALEDEQRCNGEEYLEKIIQVPFDVPMASQELVNNIFCNKFYEIVEKNINAKAFDGNYWQIVYTACIKPFIKGIRDVNRILNSFEFKYNLMKNEIDVVDLLAMTTLEVNAKSIYKWIFNSFYLLTGTAMSYGGISGVEQKENRNQYLALFKEVYPEDEQLMLKIIQTLFPRFSWITGAYYSSNVSDDDLCRLNRVASEKKIRRYFNLSLEDIPISLDTILNSICYYNLDELRDYLLELNDNNVIDYYLQELLAHVEDIPTERCGLFISILVEIYGCISIYSKTKCEQAISKILSSNDRNENMLCIMSLIERMDCNTICAIANIIEEVEYAYGRVGRNTNEKNQYITEKDLETTENIFGEKLKDVVHNLFEIEGFEDIYILWNRLNSKELENHVRLMINDAINVPKLLSMYCGTWSSSNGSTGWTFNDLSYEKYISSNDAYNKIFELKKGEFGELNLRYKEIAIAFVLWQESDEKLENFNHEINKNRVESEMKNWE